MMDPFERAAQQEAADRQNLNRVAFRIHLAVYVGVQALLVVTWALTTGPDGFPWFVFPLLGWGIGLAAHFAAYSSTRRQAQRKGTDERPAS
jgi:cytochrome b561